MNLEGSCNCGRVHYRCEADGPVPYQRCYCTFCRKTGGGGYMVNLLARADTLEVEGNDNVRVHRAMICRQGDVTPRISSHQRHFCGECGAHLWAFNDEWSKLIHPVAASVDTPLPKPPSVTHIFLGSKPDWLSVEIGPDDKAFDRYPDESIEEWHKRHEMYEGSN